MDMAQLSSPTPKLSRQEEKDPVSKTFFFHNMTQLQNLEPH